MSVTEVYICAWVMAIIGFVIGIITHCLMTRNSKKIEEDGILVLDYTDPDNPYMSLIVSNENVLNVYNRKKHVTLTIERVGMKTSHK